MRIKQVVLTIALGAFLASCSKDDDGESLPLGSYDNGILVVNEGPFQNGTGTISYISEDLETVESAIFNTVNDADLGNVIQSMGFANDKAYVVANVSNTIEVVNRYTFEQETTIEEGLENPRYFVALDGKGYVSNWGDAFDETDDYIAVINLTTNAVESTIPVSVGPEKLVAYGGFVYVANKGGYGVNNVLTVINTSTEEVLETITVGEIPNSLQLDSDNNLWVLAQGNGSWPLPENETAGVLSKINTTTNTVEASFNFNGVEHPEYLNIEGDNLYYNLGNDVFVFNTAANALPASPLVTHTATSLYGMNVSNNKLYVSDALDYASNGTLLIYDLETKEEEKSITVGLNPNGVYFNE